MVSFAITCSWRKGWNVREQPCSATLPRVKPFGTEAPSRFPGPLIRLAYEIPVDRKEMLAPKGFIRAHRSKTVGAGNETDAAETPHDRVYLLAQGLQLAGLAEHDDVGIGPQPTEIHGLRDLAPLARSGDVSHHGPARGTGLAKGKADPVHFPFANKKINTLHFCLSEEVKTKFSGLG